jgi:hypothetical protein
MIDKQLSEIFDVDSSDKKEVSTTQVIPSSDNVVETDYEAARNNLHLLLFQGQDALMGALEVAKQSEHPRAFEVVGNLMKQLADVNQQLLALHQQKQKLDEPKGDAKKQVTNNNAIFVGSTSELNKMLQDMTKGK